MVVVVVVVAVIGLLMALSFSLLSLMLTTLIFRMFSCWCCRCCRVGVCQCESDDGTDTRSSLCVPACSKLSQTRCRICRMRTSVEMARSPHKKGVTPELVSQARRVGGLPCASNVVLTSAAKSHCALTAAHGCFIASALLQPLQEPACVPTLAGSTVWIAGLRLRSRWNL